MVQSPEMLERYERFVRPAAALVGQAALDRIGERWDLAPGSTYDGPVLVVAGRLDSTVGYAVDLMDEYPHASPAWTAPGRGAEVRRRTQRAAK